MAAETALKFVLVGDSNVGKSQLSFRFCKEKFNVSSQSTVGIEFATRTISIHDYSVKAQLWDTAGQERFESMTRAYFRNAVGAILVYDVTKRQSFENLKNKWISELQEFGHHDMYIIIIGNKADLDSSQHAVRSGEAADFAESVGLDFIETSAKSGLNVDTAFRRALISVARKLPHIKESIQEAQLPEGWLRHSPQGPQSPCQYQNMWTAEVVSERPVHAAKTGMIVNSVHHTNDGHIVFRDSSNDYTHTDSDKFRQLRNEAASEDSNSNSNSSSSPATITLEADGPDREGSDKVESTNCLFSQCVIL